MRGYGPEEESVERLRIEMRQAAREFGEWEGKRVRLEKYEKAHLAILMKKHQSKDPLGNKTAAAQEREALADPEYLQTLDALREATSNAMRLKWELEIARAEVSLYQTRQANRRQEMKSL